EDQLEIGRIDLLVTAKIVDQERAILARIFAARIEQEPIQMIFSLEPQRISAEAGLDTLTKQSGGMITKVIQAAGQPLLGGRVENNPPRLLENGLIDSQVRVAFVVQARDEDRSMGSGQDAAIGGRKHIGDIEENVLALVLL